MRFVIAGVLKQASELGCELNEKFKDESDDDEQKGKRKVPNYDAPELRRPIYDASRQGRRHRGPGGDPERSGAIRSEAAPVIAARRR